jgi:RNA polymerase sigma-70 factor, ECF subfamily
MDPQKLSAQELVQLCLASQDPALWCEFVSRFRPLIFGVVVKSLRRWAIPDRALVDDLIQDTFLKLCAHNYRALRDFEYEHEHSLFGFLKKVASNVVQDYIRVTYSQKRGSGHEEQDLDKMSATTAASTSFGEDARRAILINQIARCLDQLSGDPHYSRDSAIFWLYYRHGLTAKAISELPGICLTVKGVESTLLRLTRYIRSRLDAREARRAAGG